MILSGFVGLSENSNRKWNRTIFKAYSLAHFPAILVVSTVFIIQVKLNLIRTWVGSIVINLNVRCFVCTSVLWEINKPLENPQKKKKGESIHWIVAVFSLCAGELFWVQFTPSPFTINEAKTEIRGEDVKYVELLNSGSLLVFCGLYSLFSSSGKKTISSCDDIFCAESHKAFEFKILGNSCCKVVAV